MGSPNLDDVRRRLREESIPFTETQGYPTLAVNGWTVEIRDGQFLVLPHPPFMPGATRTFNIELVIDLMRSPPY